MLNISFDRNPELYTDYEKCLSFLREHSKEEDFVYPDHITNFHTYITVVKDPKEIASVKSFLATQNLTKTKLFLWSDQAISDHPFLAPFKNLIDFRIYDPIEEAKGTLLEGHNNYLLATDTKCYLRSDLLRLLIPHKYGGIWFDMDMILLRDFKPILDQEFAHMWGSETDFASFGPGAAVLSLFKNSELSIMCLEELLRSPIIPNSCCFGNELLARVYRRKPFSVFPSVFFDTEWQINRKYPGLGTEIQRGWFQQTEHSKDLFPEAFSWHWHNSSQKVYTPAPGSKFHLLSQKIDKQLKEKGIL